MSNSTRTLLSIFTIGLFLLFGIATSNDDFAPFEEFVGVVVNNSDTCQTISLVYLIENRNNGNVISTDTVNNGYIAFDPGDSVVVRVISKNATEFLHKCVCGNDTSAFLSNQITFDTVNLTFNRIELGCN
jgi:hypothetical protein